MLPDADPASVAEGLFWGAFINNGQTCAAMKRLYVHASIHDAVCDALVAYAEKIPVGDGMDENSVLGPVQNAMQHGKVSKLVADAVTRGKCCSAASPARDCSSRRRSSPVSRTATRWWMRNSSARRLPVIRYTDVDEAVMAANDSPNGLGGSVWSADIDAAKVVGRRMECGSVWINKHGAIQPNAPFGGVKQSGFGVQFAEEGAEGEHHRAGGLLLSLTRPEPHAVARSRGGGRRSR